MEREGARLLEQLHLCLNQQMIAFPTIAGVAARDQVFPCRRASTRAWDNVVQCQLTRREHYAAVLARVAVTQQNVLAGERAGLVWNSAVFQKPDHAWQVQGPACGMDVVRGYFFG